MRYNILFGGVAGTGPNLLSLLVGNALVNNGFYAFCSREYQSLIRGGHNFNVLTFSENPIFSNDSEMDIIVCLDENTEKVHKKELKKSGIALKGNFPNIYFAGMLFKMLNLDFEFLKKSLEKKENFEENMKSAQKGYENAKLWKDFSGKAKKKMKLQNGAVGISEGAIASGLDLYFAYPMTPATSVLMELAQKQKEKNFLTFELENEIAVMMSAIGASATGAKTMVGTSGGGFDLMTEGLSVIGQAGIPLVIYLAQRPGPGTGVATTTSQGDLNLARHSGHGEFPRMILAPGNPEEASELISQAFYFSQKFKIPAIILSDKHLAESFYTISENPKITSSEKSTELIRYNGYEKDSFGSATEDANIVEKNIIERMKKNSKIEKEAKKFSQYKIYGKKQSKNVILSWGSTKGAIIDAIEKLDCKFVQILYLEPFSEKIKKELDKKNIILIENNATGQLANLLSEKTGIRIENKNKILKFNGLAFLANELKEEIKKRLK